MPENGILGYAGNEFHRIWLITDLAFFQNWSGNRRTGARWQAARPALGPDHDRLTFRASR
jgi:hypothetical protein